MRCSGAGRGSLPAGCRHAAVIAVARRNLKTAPPDISCEADGSGLTGRKRSTNHLDCSLRANASATATPGPLVNAGTFGAKRHKEFPPVSLGLEHAADQAENGRGFCVVSGLSPDPHGANEFNTDDKADDSEQCREADHGFDSHAPIDFGSASDSG